ncbi:MAG: biotin transporter BioY [Clostridia bacterium]|nr:biotin transporter BioY [Clostridia bacterium]
MKTKDMAEAALFTAVTAVFAQIGFPQPFSTVPVTLSLFAVFLCGMMLDKKAAFLSQLAYVLLGAVGAPVFYGFAGGLVRPTGGFVIAYPFMAFAAAWITEKVRGKNGTPSLARIAAAASVPLVICYAFGCLWFAFYTGASLPAAFAVAVVPFAAFDIVKAAAASMAAPLLQRALRRQRVQ